MFNILCTKLAGHPRSGPRHPPGIDFVEHPGGRRTAPSGIDFVEYPPTGLCPPHRLDFILRAAVRRMKSRRCGAEDFVSADTCFADVDVPTDPIKWILMSPHCTTETFIRFADIRKTSVDVPLDCFSPLWVKTKKLEIFQKKEN
jgi:hypothetical protein